MNMWGDGDGEGEKSEDAAMAAATLARPTASWASRCVGGRWSDAENNKSTKYRVLRHLFSHFSENIRDNLADIRPKFRFCVRFR